MQAKHFAVAVFLITAVFTEINCKPYTRDLNEIKQELVNVLRKLQDKARHDGLVSLQRKDDGINIGGNIPGPPEDMGAAAGPSFDQNNPPGNENEDLDLGPSVPLNQPSEADGEDANLDTSLALIPDKKPEMPNEANLDTESESNNPPAPQPNTGGEVGEGLGDVSDTAEEQNGEIPDVPNEHNTAGEAGEGFGDVSETPEEQNGEVPEIANEANLDTENESNSPLAPKPNTAGEEGEGPGDESDTENNIITDEEEGRLPEDLEIKIDELFEIVKSYMPDVEETPAGDVIDQLKFRDNVLREVIGLLEEVLLKVLYDMDHLAREVIEKMYPVEKNV